MAQDDYARLFGLTLPLAGKTGPLAARCDCGPIQRPPKNRFGVIAVGSGQHAACVRCSLCNTHLAWLSKARLDALMKRTWFDPATLPRVSCPTCLGDAKASVAEDGVQHACCGLWSFQGRPLASGKTWAARRKAVDAMRQMLEANDLPRVVGYAMLAKRMGGVSKGELISMMSEGNAVIAMCQIANIRRELAMAEAEGEVIDHG